MAQRIRLPHTLPASFCTVFLLVMCAVPACSSSPASTLRPDSDQDATLPTTCSVPLICDGGAVHSCDSGVVGALLDDCPSRGQLCSQGRCTSQACRDIETASTRTLLGCLFYTVQADNVTADEAAQTSYLLNNAGTDPAQVRLEQATPGSNGTATWTAIGSVQVAAGTAARLQAAELEVRAAGTVAAGALRVESDRPITVAEVESDDQSQPASSSSATVVLPVQSLGTGYRAVTYPQESTPDVQQVVGSRGGAARVIIVGTQPGTRVELTPASAVSGDPGGDTPPLAAGETLPLILNDGDVFQIYTNAPDEDLTGTLVSVVSGAPVAVFSGNISTSYGSSTTGINSADMAHEQMLPLSSWSKTWVAAPLAPQGSIGCTSFFADGDGDGTDGGSIWRVVANDDDTDVQLGPPASETIRLHAGESLTRVSSAPFTIVGSKPILVTQGMDCEPTLSLAIGADAKALLTSLAFAGVPGFDQELVIVRSIGSVIALDNMHIPDNVFQSVGGGFEMAALPLPNCGATSGACLHRLVATVGGFGMTMRGMDVSASFALTAPGLLRCDPNTVFCVN
ncbi:MAG TPA: IgGFc-binding protein [Polyangia bacterium]|nr:IgGFc-binding protein [Polyangia bacterium]